LFSRYVPATVARQLVDDERLEDVVNGVRMDASVLFCDLRGFTPLAATLQPTDVRTLLDMYYDHVCSRVLERDGTVLQFVGDEVFAVFGAPLNRADHASAAADCALAIQRDRPQLDAALVARSLPPVRFGIGLQSGAVVSAHMGPVHRRQYGVVGDTVNVGSRLCGHAGADEIVSGRALIESAVIASGGYTDLGVLQLKGVANGVAAVRLTDPVSAPPG
jgi:adenylate cyclase